MQKVINLTFGEKELSTATTKCFLCKRLILIDKKDNNYVNKKAKYKYISELSWSAKKYIQKKKKVSKKRSERRERNKKWALNWGLRK